MPALCCSKMLHLRGRELKAHVQDEILSCKRKSQSLSGKMTQSRKTSCSGNRKNRTHWSCKSFYQKKSWSLFRRSFFQPKFEQKICLSCFDPKLFHHCALLHDQTPARSFQIRTCILTSKTRPRKNKNPVSSILSGQRLLCDSLSGSFHW